MDHDLTPGMLQWGTIRRKKEKITIITIDVFLITSESNFHLILPCAFFFLRLFFFFFFFQGLWFLTRVPDVTVWMACRCLFLHPIISCFLAPCCSLVLLSSTLSQSSALGSTHTHTQKKHVGYFLLQAQCIWKKKKKRCLWEQQQRKRGGGGRRRRRRRRKWTVENEKPYSVFLGCGGRCM